MKNLLAGMIGTMMLGVCNLTEAAPITLTLNGASFAALADVVSLSPVTITVDLEANVPLTVDVQPGEFTVGDSGAVTLLFPFTFARDGSINGVTAIVAQSGQIAMTPTVDTLTLFENGTTIFDLGSNRSVHFTPHSLTLSRASLGTSPFTVTGTFLLVPEPNGLSLLLLGVVGTLGYRKCVGLKRKLA